MAAMSQADCVAVAAEWMRKISRKGEPFGPQVRADIQAAAIAADAWASANAASYNTALPVPFRTAATAAQKSDLLSDIMRKRQEVGA